VEGTLEGYPGVGFAEADWLRMGVVEERRKSRVWSIEIYIIADGQKIVIGISVDSRYCK
jgi:hypothetical protein